MKSIHALLASVALLAAMPSAFAASTVDLAVTGTIIPGSCTPTLSAGEVKFGKISSADLNVDTATNLFDKRRQSSLRVTCDAPTLFGLRAVDNRAATVNDTSYVSPYGLGLTPANEKIGAHYLEVVPTSSTIDSKAAFVSVGNAEGSTWSAAADGVKAIRNYGELLGFTDTTGVITGPVPITAAEFGLQHFLVIAPAKDLTLTDEVALDGSATIEVVYL